MKRRIDLEEIEITTPKERGFEDEEGMYVIEVYLSYQMGGRSYFTGENSARGYYLSAVPSKIIKPEGTDMKIRSTMILTGSGCGGKYLVKESSRFNQGTLEKLADKVRDMEIYDRLIGKVMDASGCQRKEKECAT